VFFRVVFFREHLLRKLLGVGLGRKGFGSPDKSMPMPSFWHRY